MKSRSFGLVAIAVLAVFAGMISVAQTATAPAFAQTAPGGPSTPPPPPPPAPNSNATLGPIFGTPLPSALPSDAPIPTSAPTGAAKRGRKSGGATPTPQPAAAASDTPEPPQFQTMDGVWEVQLQPLDGSRTKYSHLFVTQKGDQLTGTWKKDDNKTVVPFAGTFDGRLFKLNVTDGMSTLTFNGYAENFGDMVGLYTDGVPTHDGVPFTASHRKREKLTH